MSKQQSARTPSIRQAESQRHIAERRSEAVKQDMQIDYRKMVHWLADKVTDEAILRRVGKILDRAYSVQ